MPGSQGLGLPEAETLGGGQQAEWVSGEEKTRGAQGGSPTRGRAVSTRDESLTPLVSYGRPWASYLISKPVSSLKKEGHRTYVRRRKEGEREREREIVRIMAGSWEQHLFPERVVGAWISQAVRQEEGWASGSKQV